MNIPSSNIPDELLLTFQDVKHIIRKNARKIWLSATFFALLAFLFGISRPITYQAEGTFKEKSKSQSGMNKSLITQLVGESSDSDALTLMSSRKIAEQLVLKMGWQAVLVKDEYAFPLFSWQNIKNNLLTEYALLRNYKTPIINDRTKEIQVESVYYPAEIPIKLSLRVESKNAYTLYLPNGKELGTGIFGKPFSNELFSITLLNLAHTSLKGVEYHLTLLPLGKLAENVLKDMKIENDKIDKSLIKIALKHPDRHQAAAALEKLMATYQEHLHNDHQRTSDLQVDYLVQRQKEMASQLAEVMHKHADTLSSDLSNTGFATSGKAMEFLAQNQQSLKQKLLSLELDLQRLENMRQSDAMDFEGVSTSSSHEPINRISAEIRSLKQQADALNLAIRNSPTNSQAFQQSFTNQLNELDEVKNTYHDANLMLASLENNELPQAYPSLLENPKFIVKMWYERAKACSMSNDPAKWLQCKQSFVDYLTQLAYYLNNYQHNIEERLAHQQTPLAEFQGINLQTAKEIYINYSKDLSESEAQAIQQRFIISQISDPAFEISSLSTVLTDPISTQMISKASDIILSLKDSDNRSIKEQERLKADLAIQKGFLITHLQQTQQLLELRQQFLKEKILSLQSINLSLIHEQISLLENQIKKYISNAIANHLQEQKLLNDNLHELRLEMAAFPQKWASEQMIEQQMKINQTMVEEITKLVESKNISNNLEKIQSAPLDSPIIPLHPKSPRLLLLILIGGVLGSLLSIAWVLAQSISKGIETTAEHLQQAGMHVSGPLSRKAHNVDEKNRLLDNDLDTLRRLIGFLQQDKSTAKSAPAGQTLAILKSLGPNYAPTLAQLLALQGLKTLVIDLSFEESAPSDNGLLQYLEGKVNQPAITRQKSYDQMTSGGFCRYANELLSSQLFQDLLSKLKAQYDWILIVSKALPESAEAENLLKISPNAIVSLTGESWQQLRQYLQHARLPHHRVSFIIAEFCHPWRR